MKNAALRPAALMGLFLFATVGLSPVLAKPRRPASQPGAEGGLPPGIRRLVGKEPVRALAVKDYRVRFFDFGEDRQPIIKDVTAEGLWEISGVVYVAEKGTGQWIVGRAQAADPRTIEAQARFKTADELARATAYPPLPKPPAGFRLREVVRLPDFPVRVTGDQLGERLYVLMVNGDVWHLDPRRGSARRVLRGDEYLHAGALERQVLGLRLDRPGRLLYIVSNERVDERPIRNRATIWRAATDPKTGDVERPRAWLETGYPWGIGAYNHGVNNLDFGPDGMLYVSSGSRTDSNETGNDPLYSKEGETPITSCIWRLDPGADHPQVAVYARGLRNAFGFCWNDRGEMLATDNGPNADAPEELNVIRQGRHYGFPFKFSDWTRKPYPHTPDPPPGLTFELPIPNLGPDAGGSASGALYTFDAHSSPGGITYLGDDFPRAYRGGYLLTRFGNLLDGSKRVGYDVLLATLTPGPDGRYQAHMREFLNPLSRPVDLHQVGRGRIYILEYSRQQDNFGFSGNLPGRVLELSTDR